MGLEPSKAFDGKVMNRAFRRPLDEGDVVGSGRTDGGGAGRVESGSAAVAPEQRAIGVVQGVWWPRHCRQSGAHVRGRPS